MVLGTFSSGALRFLLASSVAVQSDLNVQSHGRLMGAVVGSCLHRSCDWRTEEGRSGAMVLGAEEPSLEAVEAVHVSRGNSPEPRYSLAMWWEKKESVMKMKCSCVCVCVLCVFGVGLCVVVWPSR